MWTQFWSITSASPAGSWLTTSMPSFESSSSRQQSGPSHFRFASVTFAAPTFIGSLTTFCFASSGTPCAFSLSGIIADILHSASIADEPSPSAPANPAMPSPSCSHPSRRVAELGPLEHPDLFYMSSKHQIHRFAGGNVYFWLEQDSSIHLKALSETDPVELTAEDAREFAAALISTAQQLDDLDSPKI